MTNREKFEKYCDDKWKANQMDCKVDTCESCIRQWFSSELDKKDELLRKCKIGLEVVYKHIPLTDYEQLISKIEEEVK